MPFPHSYQEHCHFQKKAPIVLLVFKACEIIAICLFPKKQFAGAGLLE